MYRFPCIFGCLLTTVGLGLAVWTILPAAGPISDRAGATIFAIVAIVGGLLLVRPPHVVWATSSRLLSSVGQSLVWAILAAALMFLADQFVPVYRDFDVRLPDHTLAVLGLASLMKVYWYVVAALLAAWPIVAARVLQLLEAPDETTWLGSLWRRGSWALTILAVPCIAYSLFRPLVILIQAVDHSPHK